MIEDLEGLRVELSGLSKLPHVIDAEGDGPAVVRVADVDDVVRRALGIVEKLLTEAEHTKGRLSRYDQLKRYTRRLEQVAAAQRRKLAVVAEVASTTPTSGDHR